MLNTHVEIIKVTASTLQIEYITLILTKKANRFKRKWEGKHKNGKINDVECPSVHVLLSFIDE